MEIITKIYRLYKENVEILLPLWGISVALLVFINRIPYLNIYPSEIMTTILVLNWLVISRIQHIRYVHAVWTILAGFVLMLALILVHADFYVDTVANTTYVILFTTLIYALFADHEKIL